MDGAYRGIGGNLPAAHGLRQSLVQTIWADSGVVTAIMIVAQGAAWAMGTSGGRPFKFMVLVLLCLAAFFRPGSAFYSVMIGQGLYAMFGTLAIPPAWNILGPYVLTAALIGQRRKGNSIPLLARRMLPRAITFAFLGWVALVSLIAGAPPGYPMFWSLMLFATGLGFQFLVRRKEDFLSACVAVVVGAALIAAWTVTRYIGAGGVISHNTFRYEFEYDPNYLAADIALGCVPGLVLTMDQIRWRKPVTGALAAALSVLCLFATVVLASRGIIIGLAVALLVTVALLIRNQSRLGVLVVMPAIAIGFAVLLSRWTAFEGGSLEMVERFDVSLRQADPTGARLGLAQAAWSAAMARDPMALIAGSGPFSSARAVGAVWGEHAHTHNAFLEYLLDYGLIGCGLFVALLLVAVGRGRGDGLDVRIVRIGQVLLVVLAGLSINPLSHLNGWIVLALVLARCELDRVSPSSCRR